MIRKNWKNKVVPFIITFIVLVIIERFLSKGNLLIIAGSIFWKICLIFLIRFLYIQYFETKK